MVTGYAFTPPQARLDILALYNQAVVILPDHMRDGYWLPLLVIFLAVPALKRSLPRYLNLEREEFDGPAFRDSNTYDRLSSGERTLADLALHLFSGANPLPDGLHNLRDLDRTQLELALFAIKLVHPEVV